GQPGPESGPRMTRARRVHPRHGQPLPAPGTPSVYLPGGGLSSDTPPGGPAPLPPGVGLVQRRGQQGPGGRVEAVDPLAGLRATRPQARFADVVGLEEVLAYL